MTKQKTITLKKILKGLESGSITIVDGSHLCNPLEKLIERKIIHYENMIDKYNGNLKTEKDPEKIAECHRMIELYTHSVNVEFGEYISNLEQNCFNCGEQLYVIVLDDKTIGYIPSGYYWDVAEASGQKYGYKAKKEDCPCCSAKPLIDAGKLTAEINFPSGEVIFQNYFKDKALYEIQKEGYHSINALQGRNELMQDLASRDVGYGQMGNMSVTVYTNNRDEVIIGSSLECYEDNLSYYTENPNNIDEDWLEEKKKAEEFKKILEDGNFISVGYISLGVWRWMCADLRTLEKYGEKPRKDRGSIKVKLTPGTYVIDHFYDLSDGEDFIYSTIKLKK